MYKKELHDPDNHDDVITHLEPDVLQCEVKWALGSITMNKASGGNGIPVELFQILKDDALKVLHSICQQIWKTQQWPQDWKRSVFIPIAKKGNAKECSNYHTIALISHTSKVMLKVLQARLQQYVNPHIEPPKQTLGRHKQNLVYSRTQEKGAVTPQETDADLSLSVQESLVETLGGDVGRQWPATGLGLLSAAVHHGTF